jgi:hypothetical protein
MEEISNSNDSSSAASRLLISGDMAPFKAPDGTVITGRAAWRDYCKTHGVTHVSDYNSPGGYWDKMRAERERAHTPGGGYDSQRRKEHLVRNFDKLRK